MATAGTKDTPERDCEAMTLQQPPLALKGGSPPVVYIHSMPAWVLEDFCQKMDCLSDYDWMRFGERGMRGGGLVLLGLMGCDRGTERQHGWDGQWKGAGCWKGTQLPHAGPLARPLPSARIL